jgi:(p)ppGpp synthase/HD superfamily hydrolase
MARDVEILIAAAQFAAERHRLQRRKGDASTPSIYHPIDVAYLLASLGGIDDVRVLPAATIHDSVEDTGTTAEELEVRFGAEV